MLRPAIMTVIVYVGLEFFDVLDTVLRSPSGSATKSL
jgi:hypothetical protein